MRRHVFSVSGALIGIMTLATVLRLLHLGSESLWLDEIISVAIAHLDWGTLWKVLSRFEANMALYYGLLHFWIKLSESEVAVRSLSVVAGLLTVPVLYALGGRMFGTRAGLISALLLATNAFHIRFSQEARAYTLVVLLTSLSSLFFIRAIERQSRADWAGYVLTGTLAVYSHFLAVLVLGAQLASLVVLRPRDVPWKRVMISISLMGLLLLPLAIFVFTRDHGQLGSVPKFRPSDIYGLFDSFTGGGKPLVLAYFVPCCIALVQAFRTWSRLKLSLETWRYAFLIEWLFGPILVGIAISFFEPLLVARYFIICLPPLVLLAAVGISSLSSRWVRAGGLVLLLALSGRAIFSYYSFPEKEDWRGATAYVVSHALESDGIFFYIDTGRLGFDYYVRRLHPAAQPWKIVFPESLDWEQELTTEDPDHAIALLPQCCQRVWLVLSHNDAGLIRHQTSRSIETSLTSQYPDEAEKQFKGVRVLLYSRGKQAR